MPTSAERPRRLSFYRRLTPSQKREYDRSDRVTAIPLPPGPGLGRATNRVVEALARGEPPAVRAAAQDLLERICASVVRRGLPPTPAPRLRILRTRPRRADGETHGLYTRDESGRAEIRVWMFTAAHRDVVKPRTFLRTLLHELVHHFDMALLDLPSSFHTIGFHARESSLLRALERSGAVVPGSRARLRGEGPARGAASAQKPKRKPKPGRMPKPVRESPTKRKRSGPRSPARPRQLDLFDGQGEP